eukprot:3231326-Prymnesium_polylepis.1
MGIMRNTYCDLHYPRDVAHSGVASCIAAGALFARSRTGLGLERSRTQHVVEGVKCGEHLASHEVFTQL